MGLVMRPRAAMRLMANIGFLTDRELHSAGFVISADVGELQDSAISRPNVPLSLLIHPRIHLDVEEPELSTPLDRLSRFLGHAAVRRRCRRIVDAPPTLPKGAGQATLAGGPPRPMVVAIAHLAMRQHRGGARA